MSVSEQPPCVCGCVHDTHLHYRDGLDCGRCGRTACPTYRAAPVPADDLHRCPRIDELEAEVCELKNLLLFRSFTLDRVPPFRPRRARALRLVMAIDELEAEVCELKNLLLFRRFILANVGKFRPQRARQLRLIAAQAKRRHLRVPQPRRAS